MLVTAVIVTAAVTVAFKNYTSEGYRDRAFDSWILNGTSHRWP